MQHWRAGLRNACNLTSGDGHWLGTCGHAVVLNCKLAVMVGHSHGPPAQVATCASHVASSQCTSLLGVLPPATRLITISPALVGPTQTRASLSMRACDPVAVPKAPHTQHQYLPHSIPVDDLPPRTGCQS